MLIGRKYAIARTVKQTVGNNKVNVLVAPAACRDIGERSARAILAAVAFGELCDRFCHSLTADSAGKGLHTLGSVCGSGGDNAVIPGVLRKFCNCLGFRFTADSAGECLHTLGSVCGSGGDNAVIPGVLCKLCNRFCSCIAAGRACKDSDTGVFACRLHGYCSAVPAVISV